LDQVINYRQIGSYDARSFQQAGEETTVRIVVVIDTYGDANGGTISTVRMVEELKARGHAVTIVTTGRHEGDFHEVPGFAPPGVKESVDKMEFLFGRGVRDVYRKAFAGADLVQVQFPFLMARKAVKVAGEMGIPVIGSCHVQPQNIIAAMGKESRLMERILFALFNFALYNQVDAIHCPSPFAARMLEAHGSRAHFRVISNGIPREYEPMEATRPDWFGDRFVLLNVGRHAMEKRQSLLIEGVMRSRYKDNIQLLLCGRGENTEMLREKGSNLPVEPLIEYVSQEDKLTYLNTADMYLHASVVELESLSCLEAIGCGLPCLISDAPNSAAPMFALDDRFIFETDNPDVLAAKIDYWYENRELLRDMKNQVLQMAEEYRFARCMDEMESFYRDIVEHDSEANNLLAPGLA
jgi:glycosyltransferase involved in cell wall biosynthesis